jgi:hypothetical protein
MSLSDRRRQPRFPFHSRATLRLAGRDLRGTLLDISVAGGLFAGDIPIAPQVGEECGLSVLHGIRPAVGVAGTVVHVHEHLVGIEFSAVDGAVAAALRMIIDLNLGTPHLLERDVAALLR